MAPLRGALPVKLHPEAFRTWQVSRAVRHQRAHLAKTKVTTPALWALGAHLTDTTQDIYAAWLRATFYPKKEKVFGKVRSLMQF